VKGGIVEGKAAEKDGSVEGEGKVVAYVQTELDGSGRMAG
jgi:hypothetical protein